MLKRTIALGALLSSSSRSRTILRRQNTTNRTESEGMRHECAAGIAMSVSIRTVYTDNNSNKARGRRGEGEGDYAEEDASDGALVPEQHTRRVRRRFPPILDTLVRDGSNGKSSGIGDVSNTNTHQQHNAPSHGHHSSLNSSSRNTKKPPTHSERLEAAGEYSMVRLSYNPTNAKVYMVRVPAIVERRVNDSNNNDISSSSSSSSSMLKSNNTTNSLHAGHRREGGGGANEEEGSGGVSGANAVESILPNDTLNATTIVDSSQHSPLRISVIADIESKAVMRLSPHHMSGMLSAMDERIALGYWRAAKRGEGKGKGKGTRPRSDGEDGVLRDTSVEQSLFEKLSHDMQRQMGMSSSSSPLSSSLSSSSSSSPSVVSAAAGRDHFGPHHVDDDVNTYLLMRESVSGGSDSDVATTATIRRKEKEQNSTSGKTNSRTTTAKPSLASDPMQSLGPRELQWYVTKEKGKERGVAGTVTLVSTLTTRQFVLNTIGVFKIHEQKEDNGDGAKDTKRPQQQRAKLACVRMTGHAVDDSLLFFHCFGDPSRRNYYVPSPSSSSATLAKSGAEASVATDAATSDHPLPSSTVVPSGSRKRLWAPVVLEAHQVVPFKAFLTSSLDEACGFGRVVDGVGYFGGTKMVMELAGGGRGGAVAPQSIVRKGGVLSTVTEEAEATMTRDEDGGDSNSEHLLDEHDEGSSASFLSSPSKGKGLSDGF